jgi:hypothetical protein
MQFRAWRGARPFWAGLLVMLGGLPIAYFPYAHLQVGHLTLAMATTAGAGSLIIGVLLVVLGLTLWFQKHVRVFAGVAAILLALVSIPVSNLGGFLIGFLLALVGGALAVSWAPGVAREQQDTEQTDPAADTPSGAPEPAAYEPPAGTAPDGHETSADAPTGHTEPPVERTDEVGEPNDLSGTSPANGANGRHSAG